MNKYAHVFNTWLLANVFNPFLLFWVMGVFENGTFDFFSGSENATFLLSIWFYIFLLSAPCLFVSWLVIGLIINSSFPTIAKLAIWLVVCAIIIFLEFILIFRAIFFGEMDAELLRLLAAPIFATWIAIVIRVPQFRRVCGKADQNAENETLSE
jgi:hypothetical protein